MAASPNRLPCDGCGLSASPAHVAERIRRLELSTRFRPVHIGFLFIVLAPPSRPEDDFYGPPKSKQFFDPFLAALEIPPGANNAATEANEQARDSLRLAEFQRRAHYLAYLSECPIGKEVEPAEATIARLAPALIRRIRFNYRPKYVVPLGHELSPLVGMLAADGVSPVLTLDQDQVLPTPGPGAPEWHALFQRAVSSVEPR